MTTPDDLLAAILADPANDNLRLVYAERTDMLSRLMELIDDHSEAAVKNRFGCRAQIERELKTLLTAHNIVVQLNEHFRHHGSPDPSGQFEFQGDRSWGQVVRDYLKDVADLQQADEDEEEVWT